MIPSTLLRLHQVQSPSSVARFSYDGVQAIAEHDGSDNLRNRYVFGPWADELLVRYEGTGAATRRWLHADERGSIIAVSGSTGASTQKNSYDAYGTPASTNQGRFQYTGQMWIPELGLYHYKARIYSPTLGRFLQTDPIGYADGMNLYAYVGNDPINRTDPSGLSPGMQRLLEQRHNVYQLGEPLYIDGQPMAEYEGDPIVVTATRLGSGVSPLDSGGSLTGRDWSHGGSGGGGNNNLPQNTKRLWDKAKDLFCKIPPLGIGGGIDAYAGVGGTVQGGYSLDIRTGQIGAFFSIGVGVGVGGRGFYQGTVNAPSGITGSVTANVAATAGVGAAGSYTLIGPGAGSLSGGGLRAGPAVSANANIAGGGSIGLPKLYDAGCGK